ncbi:hypothetical protein [Mucilaginibacter sp. SJ]|uniref:hypothetical protein n=1 Tax=Mucilaginibacter sp. SJ TaxID=3029053 RepID=UPI0023AA1180|nr:hypothetical protein [Mucilaginibacter sp. SJ]WDZ98970.1 hypothetical protein MusilaSJ_15980 [Mucilaginibacter sp. SJ]
MNIIKQIGKILSERDDNPKFINSLKKAREADQIAESISKRLTELEKRTRQQAMNL